MDVRLLGPIEYWCDGAQVAVPGRSARAVLSMLALRPGRVVLTDELVDGLWGDRIPGDPTAALYVTLSRLRVVLGPHRDRLRRVPTGYVLDADESEVDVGRVEAALEHGRRLLVLGEPAAADDVLSSALREWRHDAPLAEFADLPFAAAASSRLHRLRCEVVETANTAALSSGRALGVIEPTEAALRLEPWREQLVAQLMTALCQVGRPGEALAAYSGLASRLRADFGVEPSPGLRELRSRVAAGHAARLPPSPTPSAGWRP